MVGGLVIVADVPFQTGDRVRIRDAQGEVVQIGLRSTKLLTSDGKIAAIPNSEILTQQTFNANRSVPEATVTTDMYCLDPNIVLRIGWAACHSGSRRPMTLRHTGSLDLTQRRLDRIIIRIKIGFDCAD